MADWATISALGTAGGTLVLAAATFASVRAGNRAARLTERSLLAGLRPVLIPSREDDPTERVMFGDRHWVTVPGQGAVLEEADGNVYMALGLRNVGAGLAVLHGWYVDTSTTTLTELPAAPEEFRRQQRDLYVPAGDVGFWQGAIRDAEDEAQAPLREAVRRREPVTIYLLYGDHEGGQRTITRFGIMPGDDGALVASVSRY